MLRQTFLTVLVLMACCVALMEGFGPSRERCFCKQTEMSPVRMGNVAKIEYHMPSSSCSREELIVIFKNRRRQCLNLHEDKGRRIKNAVMSGQNAK